MTQEATKGTWFLKEARTLAHIHSTNGAMIGSLPFVTEEQKANARLVITAVNKIRGE